MEMTFNEYTSKMFSILETAIYNYEIDCLVEAAEGEENAAENKQSRWGAVKQVAKKVFSAIWTAVVNFFKRIIEWIKDTRYKPVELKTDITVLKAAVDFDGKLMNYATELQKGNVEIAEEAGEYIAKLPTQEFKAGQTVNTKGLERTATKYLAASVRCSSAAEQFSGDDATMKNVSNKLRSISNKLQAIAKDIAKLTGMRTAAEKDAADAALAEKMGKKREKYQAKANALDAKINAKAHAQAMSERVNTESVEADEIALSARLILEAASILNGEDETSEYPADDITGGEGQRLDQEEIRELLDDDREAIAILNDDEGGKAITESVIITF